MAAGEQDKMDNQIDKEKKNKIYRFWGNNPLLYQAACLVTFLGREEELRRRTAQSLELSKGDAVLDLACGTGLNFPYLEEAVGEEGRIFGFDYSKEMLEAAKKRIKENDWKNIRLIQGNAAELALEEKVEGVISTLGISAIFPYQKALERAVSTLKDGGKIAILDAQLFPGDLEVLNQFIVPLYKYGANWDPTKNIPAYLEKLVGPLKREEFNLGTIYLITGIK